MPYILPARRAALDPYINVLSNKLVHKGEVNYVMTRLLSKYVEVIGMDYNSLSSARAVLMDVYDEFTRKMMHHYEDKKEKLNGPCHLTIMNSAKISDVEEADVCEQKS